jgi:nicotinamidase-related amidase
MEVVMANPDPLPSFYSPRNAALWDYDARPAEIAACAAEHRKRFSVPSAGRDRYKVHLLLIDLQKDFCFANGSLYVGGRSGNGAVDDNVRISEFIYRNLDRITDITCTMDTHFPFQIFFSSFWLDANDRSPEPHTTISTDQIRRGEYRPNPAIVWWLANSNYGWLLQQVEHYCNSLEQAGKYTLYLWPPHCLLGSAGHALSGVIQEARLFHSHVRGSRGAIEVKGGNALTENYSVLAPEVLKRHDGLPLAQRNTGFIKTLLDSDAVLIAGQAASHCVKSTIDDLLGEIQARDSSLARKVYILRDCMSAVSVPDSARPGRFLVDFTDEAAAALKRFEDAGMHVVNSTDPIQSWAGFQN